MRKITTFSVPLAVLCITATIPIIQCLGLIPNGLNVISYVGQYQAYQYRPICGTLAADVGAFNLGDVCKTVMTAFQTSSDTYALYDSSTGIRLSDTAVVSNVVADPSGPCMCYSLASLTGVQADVCMILNYLGVSSAGSAIVEVIQLGDKALPQCGSINVTSVTSSLAALGTQTRAQVVAPTAVPNGASSTGGSNSVDPDPAATPTDSSSTSTTNAASSSSTASTSSSNIGPYGSLIWGPIIGAIGGILGIYYAWDLWRIRRRKALGRTGGAHEHEMGEQHHLPQHNYAYSFAGPGY